MRVNGRKIILLVIALCFLFPAELKIAGRTMVDLVIYSMIGLSLIDWFIRGGRLRQLQGVEKWLLYFLVVVIVSYFYNALPSFEEQKAFVAFLGLSTDFLYVRLCIYGVMTIVMIFGGYRLVVTHIKSERDVRSVVRVVLICGFFNALVSIIYWAVVTGCTFDRYNFIPPIEGSQGIHLSYMSIICLLAIAILISGEVTGRSKLFLYVLFATSGFSMLTVMVRQGWVTFLISLVLLFLIYSVKFPSRRTKRGILFLSALFVISVGVMVLRNQALLADLFMDVIAVSGSDFDQGSWLMRFALIDRGLAIFSANPFLGVGFGHYIAYSTVPTFVTGVATYVASPHNGVITVLAETGFFGFFCLIGLCYRLINQQHGVYRLCRSRYMGSVVATIYALLLVTVASQLISNSQILPPPAERSMAQSSLIIWVLLGMVAAIGRMPKEGTPPTRGVNGTETRCR